MVKILVKVIMMRSLMSDKEGGVWCQSQGLPPTLANHASLSTGTLSGWELGPLSSSEGKKNKKKNTAYKQSLSVQGHASTNIWPYSAQY